MNLPSPVCTSVRIFESVLVEFAELVATAEDDASEEVAMGVLVCVDTTPLAVEFKRGEVEDSA